jgi:hypothetical protein
MRRQHRFSYTCGYHGPIRTLSIAQRLVADGYVRPAYGRKGHLRAIWLLREDGSNPVTSHARSGTRYSFIESLDNGRCWQLRRLDRMDRIERRDQEGLATNPRDPFLQVVRDCMSPSPDALTKGMLTAKPATFVQPANPSATTARARPPGRAAEGGGCIQRPIALPSGDKRGGSGQSEAGSMIGSAGALLAPVDGSASSNRRTMARSARALWTPTYRRLLSFRSGTHRRSPRRR